MTSNGRPFFAMEYVKGMPLTKYCDQMKLSVRERLSLFIPICQAVQHAHQKGIIHRDLKPSNVLVCLYDGKPVPKVIDFGLAKAMHQPLTDKTIFTSHGLMIGTPLYMSPEQAEQNNLDVDTRTDIYSLGVILYELLTGSTPLEKAQFKEAAFQEVLRLIKEVEPPKPSTRVSGSQTLPAIAAQRSLDPAALSREIRGDLDWIVMKALEKDRVRRYETANGLAREIERYLNDEAVEACPPSTAYRLSKLYRKNRTAILTASAFGLILTAGTVISSVMAWRATVAEDAIKGERDRAVLSQQTAIKAEAAASKARDDEQLARAAESEQRTLAEQQRDEAKRLSQEAKERSLQLEKLAESQRRTIYASEMTLVRLEAQRGNLQRVREILMKQLPVDGEEDLRGFEWNYWYRFLEQAKCIRRIDNFQYGINFASGAILPTARVVAIGQKDTTQLVEIETGKVVSTIPLSMKTLTDRTPFSENGRSVYGNYASLSYVQDQVAILGDGLVVVDPNGRQRKFTYPEEAFQHVHALNISPDGKWVGALGIALTHTDRNPSSRLIIWNVESGKLTLNRSMPRELNRFAFSRDGQLVAAYLCHGSKRNEDSLREVLTVLQVDKSEEIAVVPHNDDIDHVAWLPDSKRLVLASLGFSGKGKKELLSWDIGDKALTFFSAAPVPNYVHTALDREGHILAVAGHGSPTISLVDPRDGRTLQSLHNQGTTIASMSFSYDGTQLTALGSNGEILRWNLSDQNDLFALRSKPIRLQYSKSTQLKWAVAKNLERVAVGSYMGELLIRDPKGKEFFKRDADQTLAGALVMVLSDSAKYLVVARSEGDHSQLELFDAYEGKPIWEVKLSEPVNSLSQIQFTRSEDSFAITLGGSRISVFDTKTGGRIENREPQATSFVMRSNFVRSHRDDRLLVAGLGVKRPNPSLDTRDGTNLVNSSLDIRDALNNEVILSSEWIGSVRELLSRRFIVSPDARRVATLGQSTIEIWDILDKRKILEAVGSDGEFSADGAWFMALEVRDTTAVSSTIDPNRRILRSRIFEVENGRESVSISFAGDQADSVQFSPDGKRLLSLHGKNQLPGDDSKARGKLWDASTGLEILDMPIADSSTQHWTLAMDSSGQKMVGLVFCSSNGAGGKGGSHRFDGTPLSETVDRSLIASELVQRLYQKALVPDVVIEKIQNHPKLSPPLRQEGLAQAHRLPWEEERVVRTCREIVTSPEQSMERFLDALNMAHAIRNHSPTSLRGDALLSAVQYRLGKWDEALATIEQQKTPSVLLASDPNFEWEQFMRATEVLCLQRKGESLLAHRKAIELVDWTHAVVEKAQILSGLQMWPIFVRDAIATQGQQFVTLQMRPRSKSTTSATAPPRQQSSPVDNMKRLFASYDKNRDGRVHADEVSVEIWKTMESYDDDKDNSLTFEDYVVWSIQTALNRILRERSTKQPQWERQFAERDKNSDGKQSREEQPGNAFNAVDADGDGSITLTEFIAQHKKQEYVRVVFQFTMQLKDEYGAILRILNLGLEKFPDESNLLNSRAFLFATCPNDSLRNGPQAIEDATKACEYFEWKNPAWLDTLASAYAESGRFPEAIKFQTQAISLCGDIQETKVYRDRLALYEAGKPYRELIPESEIYRQSEHGYKPLLSADRMNQSRRIRGGQPCWSPDGKALVYSLTGFGASASYLEKLDLETGKTNLVGRGGESLVWSSGNAQTIAMVRKNLNTPVSLNGDYPTEVWLVDADGKTERKLWDGSNPHWTIDGKLWSLRKDKKVELVCIDVKNPEQLPFSIPWNAKNFAIASDGERLIYSVWGKWQVIRLDDAKSLSISLQSDADDGYTEWSPNGRWIVFGASSASKPGSGSLIPKRSNENCLPISLASRVGHRMERRLR